MRREWADKAHLDNKRLTKYMTRCGAAGSARALGARCRRFESCHLDHRRCRYPLWGVALPFLSQSKRIKNENLKSIWKFNFTYNIGHLGTCVRVSADGYGLHRADQLQCGANGCRGGLFDRSFGDFGLKKAQKY